MGTYTEAGKIGDFPEGMPKKLVVSGQEILLVKVDGDYYAVANRCPHLRGDLSQGKLEGNIITCPEHFSQFDITDGSVVRWLKGSGLMAAITKTLKGSKSLKTYLVKVEDDSILIET